MFCRPENNGKQEIVRPYDNVFKKKDQFFHGFKCKRYVSYKNFEVLYL